MGSPFRVLSNSFRHGHLWVFSLFLPFFFSSKKKNNRGLQNLQVLMDETGEIIIGYLGTDPSGYVPVHVERKEIDLKNIGEEMKELKKKINRFEHNLVKESTECIQLKVKCPKTTSTVQSMAIPSSISKDVNVNTTGHLKCVHATLDVYYKPPSTRSEDDGIENIQIFVKCDKAFLCNRPQILCDKMGKLISLFFSFFFHLSLLCLRRRTREEYIYFVVFPFENSYSVVSCMAGVNWLFFVYSSR